MRNKSKEKGSKLNKKCTTLEKKGTQLKKKGSKLTKLQAQGEGGSRPRVAAPGRQRSGWISSLGIHYEFKAT